MERKLDISAISFDDMLGEGVETQEVESPAEQLDNEVDAEEVVEDEEIVNEEVDYDEEEVNEEVDEDDDDYNEDEEGEPSPMVINEIADTLGFELNGDYDDTVEGLTNFVRDISQQAAEDQLQSLFEQYPEVQKHLDFVMSGGQSERFMEAYNPQTDFAAIEIDENNINTQRALLGQYFLAKGHDQEFIEEMLDTMESNGKLYDKSLKAKDELAYAQEEYRKQVLAEQKRAFDEEQKEIEEYWNGVANTIEDGNVFAGITIPDRKKSEFFGYISQVVGPNGETQRDLDMQELDMETRIAMDYLAFTGFKLDDIIDKKARTKSAQSLRERIISNEERVKSARKARRSKKFDVDSLDMGALLG
jgi:hypothetical protein